MYCVLSGSAVVTSSEVDTEIQLLKPSMLRVPDFIRGGLEPLHYSPSEEQHSTTVSNPLNETRKSILDDVTSAKFNTIIMPTLMSLDCLGVWL